MAIPEKLKNNLIYKYLAESRSELEKVTWPSRQTLINHTLLVIGLSAVLALFLGAADYLLNFGVEYLIK